MCDAVCVYVCGCVWEKGGWGLGSMGCSGAASAVGAVKPRTVPRPISGCLARPAAVMGVRPLWHAMVQLLSPAMLWSASKPPHPRPPWVMLQKTLWRLPSRMLCKLLL